MCGHDGDGSPSPSKAQGTVRNKHPAVRHYSPCYFKFWTESSLNQAWFRRVRCAKLCAEIFVSAEVHYVIDSYVSVCTPYGYGSSSGRAKVSYGVISVLSLLTYGGEIIPQFSDHQSPFVLLTGLSRSRLPRTMPEHTYKRTLPRLPTCIQRC